jgi:predicted dehydrogenase
MPRMSDVGIALIGAGFMGRAHSNAWRQVPVFFTPRLSPRRQVICCRDRTRAEDAAARLGWAEASTDWKDVINRTDIGIVDVSTPGDSHAEIAIAAARAGKAVICEKPLANTVRDAERMLSAAERAGVVHMICHNYRRVPAVTLAKQIIDEGRIGTIRHFRGVYLQDWANAADLPMRWRLDRTIAGSGALGDLASHVIDLARYLAGDIAEVASTMETFIKTRRHDAKSKKTSEVTVDDAVVTAVRFANGAIGSIEATRFAPGRKNYNRFEINGSAGSIVFDLERLNEIDVYFTSDPPPLRGFRTLMLTDPSQPYMSAWWPAGHIIGWEHTFIHTMYDLLEAVADSTIPSPSFDDGVKNQRVLDAIERSSRSRRWVRIKGVS